MELVPLLGAVCTLALGILGLLVPRRIADLIGVAPEGALGLSEIRATYGGLFIGLGAACLWFQQSEVYVAVGVAWLLAAVSRMVSIFLDQSFSSKNVGGVIVEAGIGLFAGCWLKKAQEQVPKADAEALLSARLAPDMFPLSTQVRFACVQAQEAIFRLKGEPFPESINELLEEGRNAGESPGSLADAQARIDETIALLDSLAPNALDAMANKPLVHELPNGMVLDLTAEQYARDWTLGQFYFHLMTAYSVLRSEKIELGKADYVAHLFPYIRPETIPKG